jgi:hypothetical protein
MIPSTGMKHLALATKFPDEASIGTGVGAMLENGRVLIGPLFVRRQMWNWLSDS